MVSENQRVHLAIGSQYENIELVQIVVEESLRKLELADDVSHAVGMAVREAVANAIEHGNRRDPEKTVEIEFGIEDEVLVIQVCDQGEGFDPAAVADPLNPTNLLRPNGRGIFFMNNFMDEIDYSFRAEGGTMVTLRKRLLPAEEAAEEDR
jgi:serine/threonine-protein kinase RsbW